MKFDLMTGDLPADQELELARAAVDAEIALAMAEDRAQMLYQADQRAATSERDRTLVSARAQHRADIATVALRRLEMSLNRSAAAAIRAGLAERDDDDDDDE
jgi:hypothetical protein